MYVYMYVCIITCTNVYFLWCKCDLHNHALYVIYMCMYVYLYVCVYVRLYVCMYIHICVTPEMYACICECLCVFLSAGVETTHARNVCL